MNIAEEAARFQSERRVETGRVRKQDAAVAALMAIRDDLRRYIAKQGPLNVELLLKNANAGLA